MVLPDLTLACRIFLAILWASLASLAAHCDALGFRILRQGRREIALPSTSKLRRADKVALAYPALPLFARRRNRCHRDILQVEVARSHIAGFHLALGHPQLNRSLVFDDQLTTSTNRSNSVG